MRTTHRYMAPVRHQCWAFFSSKVSECVDGIISWMLSNRLQLNLDKTEFMWYMIGRRQHRLPITALMIGSTSAIPVSSVRDFGMYIDSNLMMRTRMCKMVSRCFATLRLLRSIRRLVSTSVLVCRHHLGSWSAELR
jgi:hypothetical protein